MDKKDESYRIMIGVSGGIDSCVLLSLMMNRVNQDIIITQNLGAASGGSGAICFAKQPNLEIIAVVFEYDSEYELSRVTATSAIFQYFRIHRVTRVNVSFLSTRSNLTEGLRYAVTNNPRIRPSDFPPTTILNEPMEKPIILGRDLIFASIMTSMAMAYDCREVMMGLHADDEPASWAGTLYSHFGYLTRYYTGKLVSLELPFWNIHKSDIIDLGDKHQAPFSLTRTCQQRGSQACGICEPCRKRANAFREAGVNDPSAWEV